MPPAPPPARPGDGRDTPGGGDGTPVLELAPPRPSLQLPCALLATFSPPPCRFFAPSLQCRYSKVSCILLAVSLRSPCALLARFLLFLCTLHTIPCHPNSFHPPSNLLPLRSSPGTEGGGGEPSLPPPTPPKGRPRRRSVPAPPPLHPPRNSSDRRCHLPTSSPASHQHRTMVAALFPRRTGGRRDAIAAGARGAQRGAAPGGAAMGRLRSSGARGGGTPASARRREAEGCGGRLRSGRPAQPPSLAKGGGRGRRGGNIYIVK